MFKTYSLSPHVQLAQGFAAYMVSASPQNFLVTFVASVSFKRESSSIKFDPVLLSRFAHGLDSSAIWVSATAGALAFLLIFAGPFELVTTALLAEMAKALSPEFLHSLI